MKKHKGAASKSTTSVRGPTSALTSFLQEQGISARSINAKNPWRRRNAEEDEKAKDEEQGAELADGAGAGPRLVELPENRLGGKSRTTTAASERKRPRANAKAAEARRDLRLMLPGLDEYVSRVPPLVDLCIRVLSEHLVQLQSSSMAGSDDEGAAAASGRLPAAALSHAARDKLARILSRKRRVSRALLPLLCPPPVAAVDAESETALLVRQAARLAIYDATPLNPDDYIFAFRQSAFSQLTILELEFCGRINDAAVTFAADTLTALKELTLYGAYLVTDAGWEYLFSKRGSQLFTLRLSYAAMLAKKGVAALLATATDSLEILRLAHADSMTSTCYARLAELESLEELDLRHTGRSLESSALSEIIKNLGPRLKVLKLCDIPEMDGAVWNLDLALSHLSKLEIKECPKFNSSLGLAFLCAALQVPRAAKLEELQLSDLRGLQADEDEEKVCANLITQLLKEHAGSLAVLHIDGLHCVHGDKHDEFEQLFTLFVALRELSLSWIDKITNENVIALLSKCPLERLRVFGCRRLVASQLTGSVNSCGKPVQILGLE